MIFSNISNKSGPILIIFDTVHRQWIFSLGYTKLAWKIRWNRVPASLVQRINVFNSAFICPGKQRCAHNRERSEQKIGLTHRFYAVSPHGKGPRGSRRPHLNRERIMAVLLSPSLPWIRQWTHLHFVRIRTLFSALKLIIVENIV